MDLFVAVTNDDEANILSSMLAKRLGVGRAITLINRSAYVDLVQSTGIDVAVSPAQATIGRILAHVRRGDVAMVHSLRRGAAEAIELLAHGDASTSKVVGRRLDQVRLPRGVTIGAIVRGDEVVIAHRHVVIEPEDHVILFLVDKRKIADVEKLFQVGLEFF
jgi:trk system potassium uptake protein TrkA